MVDYEDQLSDSWTDALEVESNDAYSEAQYLLVRPLRLVDSIVIRVIAKDCDYVAYSVPYTET